MYPHPTALGLLGFAFLLASCAARSPDDSGDPPDSGSGTMAPPSWLPDLEIIQHEQVNTGKYLMGAAYPWVGGVSFTFILDREGHWLWSQQMPAGQVAVQLDFARDGSGDLLYATFDSVRSDDLGAVHRVTLDGAAVGDPRTIPMGHHFFYEHADGTIAYLALDVRSWTDPEDGVVYDVGGDNLVEIAPDGTSTTLWSTWDHFEVTKDEGWDMQFYPNVKSWTHANAVHYNPQEDTYTVSLAGITTIVEIERGSGDITRVFQATDAPDPGAIGVSDPDDVFDWQHDPHWTDAGTLLMVSTGYPSHVVEYTLEDDTLHKIWSYNEDAAENSFVLGSARRLPNGHTLYSSGAGGYIRDITPDGEVAWGAQFPAGMAVGNVVAVDQLPPAMR